MCSTGGHQEYGTRYGIPGVGVRNTTTRYRIPGHTVEAVCIGSTLPGYRIGGITRCSTGGQQECVTR